MLGVRCVSSHRYGRPSVCLCAVAVPGVKCKGQQGVFHQNGHSSQDERGKQVHVDIISHTVKLPTETQV